MVYRGKPSLGCELCRRRKIRCDQARPSCGQCIKHGVVCPGYRDLGTSNFLDESQAVIRRAQSKRDNSSPSRRQQSRPASDINTSLTVTSTGSLDRLPVFTTSPPAIDFEDRALDYFYNSFVSPGYILFLPDRDTLSKADPVLRNAVLCTACSAFANTHGSKSDLVQARRRYARALSLTNDALRDVETARKDQTLVAVLLLNLFENLDCDNLDRISSWQNHIRGCSALLRLRDPSKLLTPGGFELFAQLRPLVLVNCMWDNTPVPPHWADYLRFSDKYHSPRQRIVNALVWVGIDVATTRSLVRDGIISDPMDIYHRVKKLDERLAAWEALATSNPLWRREEIVDPKADADNVWRGTMHKYNDFGVSGNWGMLRCVRILMGSMMSFSLLRAGADPTLEEQLEIARLRSKMINDALASTSYMLTAYVKQHVGIHGIGVAPRPGINAKEHASMPKISAYFEQLVLYFIGESIITISEEARDECDFEYWARADAGAPEPAAAATPAVREGRQLRIDQLAWIIGRLEFIGRCGIRQGQVYASMLSRKWTPGVPFTDPNASNKPWRPCISIQERVAALRKNQWPRQTAERFGSPEGP